MDGWEPTTEEDLRFADDNGVLEESQRYEFKGRLGKPGGAGNIELAKDLASLAVNGGVLIVGINDKGDRPPTLAPLNMSGLAERVGQIASMRCDPPLFVETNEIRSDDQPGLGYLVVRVPPSPLAPHMVDGRYWGRDDRSKRHLTDREVSQIVVRRERMQEFAERELNAFISRDPVGKESGELGHFYGVAVPLTAARGQFRASLDADHPTNDVRAAVFHHEVATAFAPNVSNATHQGRRHDGWAFASTPQFAQSQEVAKDEREDRLVGVEVSEEGLIRLFNGRVTAKIGDSPLIMDRVVVGMTYELVSIAATVGRKMGYLGMWALGVALRGPLRGLSSASAARAITMYAPPFGSDSYTEMAQATTSELEADPGSAGYRLIGRFMRSLDMDRSPELLGLLGMESSGY